MMLHPEASRLLFLVRRNEFERKKKGAETTQTRASCKFGCSLFIWRLSSSLMVVLALLYIPIPGVVVWNCGNGREATATHSVPIPMDARERLLLGLLGYP